MSANKLRDLSMIKTSSATLKYKNECAKGSLNDPIKMHDFVFKCKINVHLVKYSASTLKLKEWCFGSISSSSTFTRI